MADATITSLGSQTDHMESDSERRPVERIQFNSYSSPDINLSLPLPLSLPLSLSLALAHSLSRFLPVPNIIIYLFLADLIHVLS